MHSANALLCRAPTSALTQVPQPGSWGWEGGSVTTCLGRAQWRTLLQPPSPCLLAESSPERGLVAGGDQLHLSPLQPFHQGWYTCLARGPGTTTRKDFMVLVRGRASPGWWWGPCGPFLREEPSSPSSSLVSFSS